MKHILLLAALIAAVPLIATAARPAADTLPAPDDARAAMRKATEFMLSISTEGGYLYKYSPDLKTRAGEQMAADFQIWMQPPGTPTMGETFLKAHAATKDPFYLDAARRAADALARCQLESGGWHYSGSFNPEFPNKDGARSYQGEAQRNGKHPDNPHYFVATTFDDNTTQSAITFLMRYAAAAGDSKDPRDIAAKAALERALACMLRTQYPNGAWPQRYKGAPRNATDHPVRAASYPKKPAGKWPDADYTAYYTLNDNTQRDCIFVMFEAWKRFQKPEYIEAARKGADFILLAQMPAPQRGWAQQYDFNMNPVWARSFEPPAISSMESRSAMSALLEIYLETGDEKYMDAIGEGVAWLRRSTIGDNLWSRFHELKTNKPIYCDNNGKIYYDNKNARPGYNWESDYRIPAFLADYEKLKTMGRDAYLAEKNKPPATQSPADMAARARAVIGKLDAQGRWITKDRFLKRSEPADLITTETYMASMDALVKYVEACAAADVGDADTGGGDKPTKPAKAANPRGKKKNKS
jgi:PelA/Pel-15E family pectate lyase